MHCLKKNRIDNPSNRRMAPRVDTCNLISQISLDEDGSIISSSMGIAFNISKTGLLLETSHEISSEYVSLMTSDLGDNLIEIKGRVVYSRQAREDKYETGICFIGSDGEKRKFSQKLIQVYHYRKNGRISEYI